MEVRNGFIVGVFNYCDRWCEACALTSRCRLFADMARIEASMDPHMTAVVHAPPLPRDLPPAPPPWMEEFVEAMNEAADRPLSPEELKAFHPVIPAAYTSIHVRAAAYASRIRGWLASQANDPRVRSPHDPVAVIAWFAALNRSKIYRALTGLAEDDGDRSVPADHDGSAKVALIGIDRSRDAWGQLREEGRAPEPLARWSLEQLTWLGARLESVFPEARRFVRPGFDELDEVSALPPD